MACPKPNQEIKSSFVFFNSLANSHNRDQSTPTLMLVIEYCGSILVCTIIQLMVSWNTSIDSIQSLVCWMICTNESLFVQWIRT